MGSNSCITQLAAQLLVLADEGQFHLVPVNICPPWMPIKKTEELSHLFVTQIRLQLQQYLTRNLYV